MAQGQKTVLVVEDDPDIRASLKMLLDLEGYRVLEASDGAEALQVLADDKGALSLILLDLMMPVMDGFQFRDFQKENPNWSDIPVVIMSADGNVDHKRGRADAKAYLRKPFSLEDVAETVARFCR